MTFLTLAVRNVRHELRNYAAYFLSSTFAVWLFFLYASLLDHPDFGPGKVPEPVRIIMVFMEIVVALFSTLFILYAHSAFLRSRQKELGLMSMLGMLPRQIAGVIWRENALIGLGAIGAGVGLGVIFSRLFFLGIGKALDLPRPLAFHFSPFAALLSLLVFGLLFGVVSLFSLVLLRRMSVAEILRTVGKPKAPPRFSVWQSLLGVGTLTAAYYIGLSMSRFWEDDWLFGMMLLAIVGTYFLFAQGGTLLLKGLRRQRWYYWRETNLITLSQLTAKLRDNARILFMVAILSTTVITLITIYYAGMSQAEANAQETFPVSIMMNGEPGGLSPGKVDEILAEQSIPVGSRAALPAVTGTLLVPRRHDPQGGVVAAPMPHVLVASESAVNRWIGELGLGQAIQVPDGHAAVVAGQAWFDWQNDPVQLSFEQEGKPAVALPGKPGSFRADVQFPVAGPLELSVVNGGMLVVLPDAAFAQVQSAYPQAAVTVTGWMLPRWKESDPAFRTIWRAAGLPEPTDRGLSMIGALTATAPAYRELKQSMAFMVFLSSFVGLLFFLASGNMLYFKLFTDLREDRKQFQVLYKLGLGEGQVRRIISTQTAVLFFAPLLVAVAHSVVMIRLLGSLARFDFWRPLALVTALYLGLFGAYFLVARRTYTAALLD